MTILDVFNEDAFSMTSLTDAMQTLPHAPSRLGQLGLFSDKPVSTITVAIEEKDGQLSLLPTKARGTAGSVVGRNRRRVRQFGVPHIPHEGALLADDLQGVRAFGQETQTEVFSTILNEELTQMKQNHEVTHEWHRMGALKGIILDADGSTIYNLFDEFGVSETTVDFAFGTATTDVKARCLAVIRAIRDALGADTFTGVHAVCGDTWFDALVAHPLVADAYERWREGEHFRTQQYNTMFTFAGITFENYRGKVGSQDFLAATQARFFPVGVPNLFKRYLSPADFIETVNTLGRAFYAKQHRMKHDKGIELHTQSNPLHICRRPSVLIKGTQS